MPAPEDAIDIQPLAIDLRRTGALVQQELVVFRELAPHSTHRRKRLAYASSFVVWAVLFLPEAFSDERFSELEALLNEVRRQNDFDHEVWVLVAPLDVAAFALSGNQSRLEMILGNLDHRKSFRRQNVQNALALAAMLVPWELPGLMDSITSNTRSGHSGAHCAAIVAVARGPRDAKKAALEKAAQALGSDCERLHVQLASGEAVENPFVGHVHRFLFMALHRLALLPAVIRKEEPKQTELWWRPFNEGAGLVASAMLWNRLHGYPMVRQRLAVTDNLAPWPSRADSLE